MNGPSRRDLIAGGLAALAGTALGAAPALAEQRNGVSFLRGPYNLALFHRHNRAYRIGAGMHFFHSKQHDLLQLTPLADHAAVDRSFEAEAARWLREPPRTEPKMEYYSSYVSRAMHTLFRAIDWTHMHHEQTYDVMAYRGIPWSEKKAWTDRTVRYYLTRQTTGLPRSVAPLDVTMRRAGLMMKPYFNFFRTFYPRDQSLFYVAHWWHPALYEAQMIGGNEGQDATVPAVVDLMYRQVMARRPQRMLLSREIMPRYSRMSPESGNIFDNLHMLHGIAYSILAYEGWTVRQKRDEMYRVIRAMSYQPGDERLARKFSIPRQNVDPRTYPGWMRSAEGEMSRIMQEMMQEMMPMMMPRASAAERRAAMEQLMKIGRLGVERGEDPGSLHDALMRIVPDMQVMQDATEPGATPEMMVRTMLRGWQSKYGGMRGVPGIDMTA
ncbi:hypothetical protein [uncultured Jannaschia sp.]|uniref:hypothetical protein n=1 Tax=uncultured Jannaschia sp. TaxID=293347 RepID=UPI002629E664|nr:hypothetical protein [uncultured Jannaschia sp.]